MASPIAPDIAPIFTRDRVPSSAKPGRKGSGLLVISVIAMLLLVVIGFWRASHNAASKNSGTYAIMAASEIPAGTTLRFTMLRSVPMPKHSLSPGMISDADALVGKVTRTFIPRGEPILTSDVFPQHEGLSVGLKDDERAITLALTDDALLDHIINPGDHVDVIAVSSWKGKKYTRTICQDVRVLMCMPKGETAAHHTSDMNKITLAVTPRLTEVVTEAAEVGKIRLVLRNKATSDQESLTGADPQTVLPAIAATENATQTEIQKSAQMILPPPPVAHLDSPPPPPAAQEAPKPLQWIVEMISGNRKEQVSVPKR